MADITQVLDDGGVALELRETSQDPKTSRQGQTYIYFKKGVGPKIKRHGAAPENLLLSRTLDAEDAILNAARGVADGVATLDGTTRVPTAQLGTGVADGTKVLFGNGTWAAPGAGITSHGALDDLLVDDHTQYALLAGRATAQTLYGGVASGQLNLRNNSTQDLGWYIGGSGTESQLFTNIGSAGTGIVGTSGTITIKSNGTFGITVGTSTVTVSKQTTFNRNVTIDDGSNFRQFLASDGASSTLAHYGRNGDTNTGINFPSADQVALMAGGVNRLICSTTAVVINETALTTLDFRVEAGATAGMIHVDSAAANGGNLFLIQQTTSKPDMKGGQKIIHMGLRASQPGSDPISGNFFWSDTDGLRAHMIDGRKGQIVVGSAEVYAPTNVSTDRAFDADTVAIAELADVVGTLIADLQAVKAIAA